ncbi:MAG: beta-N-acetylhexosaminidase [Deltaproteobacteria bacterium]|nr:beta-N-acetylhexosaminidase [Deltaproteobacteria bacterium]
MLRNLVGQHFIFGFEGTSVSSELKSFIKEYCPSGFILFKHNVESPQQLVELCTQLQKASSSPLFIGIDQEGGRVMRLGPPFIQAPPAHTVASTKNPSLAFELSKLMGEELLSVGINLNFSPVCDVLVNEFNAVIGDRAYGGEPATVSQYCIQTIRGFLKSGILPCAKHYPGHGTPQEDSHLELPKSDAPLEILVNREFKPFAAAIEARVPFIMTAHILYSYFDKHLPATLTPSAMSYLREKMNFPGIIISDDMNMKAVSKNFGEDEALALATEAGIDILLYCDQDLSHHVKLWENLYQLAEEESFVLNLLEQSYSRISKIKTSYLTSPIPSPNTWQTTIDKSKQQKLLKKIPE